MTPTSRSRARRRTPKPAKTRIPRGFHTVTPSLAVVNGIAALEFYRRAFGAKELFRQTTPGGKLIHGRLRIGDSIVMLSDVFEGSERAAPSTVGTTTVILHIYSTNVEALWNRAVAAGAKVTMPLEDQYWGERYGHLVDPFGHRWSLSMPVRIRPSVRDAKRREALAAFSAGEHPSRVPPDTDI
ncbi:MAG TPA: VOC family protein [Thermoplasmata archaeon]|nr:VOC family protein [Thermoplasmata archaeon]